MNDAERAVAGVVRESYGRLISYLAARSHDVALAEDALSEAFESALRTWPNDGVPEVPEAWLLKAAQRRLIDRFRRDRSRDSALTVLRHAMTEAEGLSLSHRFPDERLRLLFVCAHPGIDPRLHTPLMLQVVLGLDASAIGAAFLSPSSTMGQRLSRAKAKIKATNIAFEIPTGAELLSRLSAVLEAVYAAYTHGWSDVDGADVSCSTLTDEALFLARMLVTLLPQEPETKGLLALLCYCEARRAARRTVEGAYVPLSRQDVRHWNATLLREADRSLESAARQGRVGRFQLEAAVQGAHADGLRRGSIDWPAISLLYEGLLRVAPTMGAQLGRCVAVSEAVGASQGLALLERIPVDLVRDHQPYWATRAHLLRSVGRDADADVALGMALRLTKDPAVRAFLQGTRKRSAESGYVPR